MLIKKKRISFCKAFLVPFSIKRAFSRLYLINVLLIKASIALAHFQFSINEVFH